MDQRSNQTKLSFIKRDIKFLTVNMLNKNLVEIEVQNNKIKYLPDELCELSNLAMLNCSSNLIETLPDNIGLLTNLRTLQCSVNKI